MPEPRSTIADARARPPGVTDRPPSSAFLSPCWPADLASNGIATYVGNIIASLRSLGRRPCVLSLRVGETAGDGPPVYDLSPALKNPPLLRRIGDGLARRFTTNSRPGGRFERAVASAAVAAIRDQNARILEMEESFGWAAGVGSRLPIPVVVRLHGPWFLLGPLNGIVRDQAFEARVRREREGVRAARGVTSPSKDILQRIRAEYGLPLDNAVVIPNPGPVVPPADRWRLADSDRQTVLFIGRFDHLKGSDVLIDAFVRVARAHPQALLRFVGEDRGLIDDGGRRWSLPEFLAERAPEAMAAGRIECLGRLPNSSLAALRRRAFVTVAPSRYETFGLTVLEAAAVGAPVVASRTGGIPEIVDDGQTGLLVPPGDPEALALAIGRLFDNPDLAARLGQRAGEVAARDFHPDEIARRTAEYHESIIDRH